MKGIHFDDILEEIGPIGPYQILTTVLLGLALFATGFHHMGSVFIAGLPVYHCAGSHDWDTRQYSSSPAVNGSMGDSFIAMETEDACLVTNGNITEACTKWSFEKNTYKSTIASEWDLVCSKEWKLALSQSIYMMGVLIGAIVLGNLSDIFGRKWAFFVSLMGCILSGCTAAFMPSYWLFVLTRFVVGIFASGIITCGFVLMMEVLGKRYRVVAGIFFQGWFACGYMLLAVIAYFIRDYRYIQLTTGLLPIVYLSFWWFLRESPRWLFTEGRYEEGLEEIKRAARMNKKKVPQALMNKEVMTLNNDHTKQEHSSQNHTALVLLKTPNMRCKTLNIWYQWFVVSMIYYGLSMGVGDLAGGPYVNLILSGCIEFPGYFIAVLVLDRVGRRLPMAGFNFVGGIACICMACMPSEYRITIICFSLIGKMSISAGFALIYVYSAELFPTVTRTLGVGSGSMCARIGSLLSPFIALTGTVWNPLPHLMFGGFALLSAALALLLPETLNQPLPESVADGEEFGKGTRCCSL